MAAVDTERSWPAAATSDAAEGFEAGAATAAAGAVMAAVAFMGGACGTAAMVSGGAMGTVNAGAVGTAYAAKIKQNNINSHQANTRDTPCQHWGTILH